MTRQYCSVCGCIRLLEQEDVGAKLFIRNKKTGECGEYREYYIQCSYCKRLFGICKKKVGDMPKWVD